MKAALRAALGHDPGAGPMRRAMRDAREHGQPAHPAPALRASASEPDPIEAARQRLRKPAAPTNGHAAEHRGPPTFLPPVPPESNRRQAIAGLIDGSFTEAAAAPYLLPGDLAYTRRGEWPPDLREAAG